MNEAYDPNKVNAELFGGAAQPTSTPPVDLGIGENRVETAPLDQGDAIILKDQKEEFDRTPIPPAIYNVQVAKADFGFDKNNKPKINIQLKINGPAQIGRVVFLNLAPRSNDFGAIMLKKFLVRAQTADAKGEYQSLIGKIDVNVPFDERKFCELGIAIGAEMRANVGIGKPYKNRNTGEMITPNSIKDIMPPEVGQNFM